MGKRVAVYSTVLFLLLPAMAALGQTPAAELQAVTAVLTEKNVPSSLFSAGFLMAAPAAQLTNIRDQITSPLGSFVSVDGSAGQYTAHYTRGTLGILIHLNAEGKIDGLRFHDPVVSAGSEDEVTKAIKNLPGTTSYLILQDGKEVASLNATTPLSVGSTFKLAVLNALRKQIASGKRRWDEVVRLQPSWKSLPSGVLQGWPYGSPLTIQTLAAEMISVSDNTAADSLIHIVGRTAIAPLAGDNNPFLTTREMFVLKSKSAQALRDRYRQGDAKARAALLASIDRMPLPDIMGLDLNPKDADIEWHFSNAQLCTLMSGVAGLAVMRINPGLASQKQWKAISYKGGSDAGIINMTYQLTSKSGKTFCVSVTENNTAAAIDENGFAALMSTLLGVLSSR